MGTGTEVEQLEERKEVRQHVERLLVNNVPDCASLAYQVELERAKHANQDVHRDYDKLHFTLQVIQTVCLTVFAVTCVLSLTHVVNTGLEGAAAGKKAAAAAVAAASTSNNNNTRSRSDEWDEFWMLHPPHGFFCGPPTTTTTPASPSSSAASLGED